MITSAKPDLRAALLCMSQRGLRVGALPTLVFRGTVFCGVSKGKPIEGTMPRSVLEAVKEAHLRPSCPFRNQTARRLADRVRRHCERLAARGLVETVYSAHDLRHFFAVGDYHAHRDIYRLKELLGHSDLRNTERYLRSLKVL
jgi:integrase